jgi:hypothetical protein
LKTLKRYASTFYVLTMNNTPAKADEKKPNNHVKTVSKQENVSENQKIN